MLLTALVSVVLPSLLASAATINVTAGVGGLNFVPGSVNATVNDTVVFSFAARHAVTEGTFATPCSKKPGGFDSEAKNPGDTYTVQVKDTNTIWIHCDLPGHCPDGMVFAINPPTSGDETYDNYKAKAQGKKITTSSGSSTSTSGKPNSSGASTTYTTTGSVTSPPSSPPTTTTTTKGGASKRYPDEVISLLAAGLAIFATALAMGPGSPTYSMFV